MATDIKAGIETVNLGHIATVSSLLWRRNTLSAKIETAARKRDILFDFGSLCVHFLNHVYKNVEAHICLKFKNIIVILLVAISISFPASDEI